MPALAERGTRLLAATIDELILLAIALPMVFGAIPAIAALLGLGDLQGLDNDSVSAALDSASTAVGSLSSTAVLHAMLSGGGAITSGLALIVWGVITSWFVAANGQSIGKRVVGIKVVRRNGSRASFARIFVLRNAVNALPNLLPYVGLLYQLIDPLFIYHESRRCIHDMIADTIVVRCNDSR